MFIQIDEKIECSKCGSKSYESFSDTASTGLRCLKCGHEERKPHRHLASSSGGTVSWSKSSSDKPRRF